MKNEIVALIGVRGGSNNFESHCRPMLSRMRDFLSNKGIDFINSTVGGVVDILPRMDLRDAVSGAVLQTVSDLKSDTVHGV